MDKEFYSFDVINAVGFKNYFSKNTFNKINNNSVLTFVSLFKFNRVDLVYYNYKYLLFFNFKYITSIENDLIYSFMISCIKTFHLTYIVHTNEYQLFNLLYDNNFNYEILRKEICKYEQLCC